jgi:hypothetical protein
VVSVLRACYESRSAIEGREYEENSRQSRLNAQEPGFFAGSDGRGCEEDCLHWGADGVDASGVVVGADLESQVEQAYKNVLEVLRSVGATQENVVKQTILVAKGQEIRAGYAAAQRVWERIL